MSLSSDQLELLTRRALPKMERAIEAGFRDIRAQADFGDVAELAAQGSPEAVTDALGFGMGRFTVFLRLQTEFFEQVGTATIQAMKPRRGPNGAILRRSFNPYTERAQTALSARRRAMFGYLLEDLRRGVAWVLQRGRERDLTGRAMAARLLGSPPPVDGLVGLNAQQIKWAVARMDNDPITAEESELIEAAKKRTRAQVIAEANGGEMRELAQQEAYRQQIEEGIIEADDVTKTWVAIIDDVTRESHYHADGTTIGANEQFFLDGNEYCEFPLDSSLSPANRLNCRCRCEWSEG